MNLYLTVLIITSVCLGLQFEPAASWAAWDATAIIHGQWWRIVTGNFTHTNFYHFGMNIAAFWLIVWIFKPQSRQLVGLLILNSVTIGGALFASSLTHYVGLSGVLHGLFAFWALQEALNGRRSSWILCAAVVAKVLWEQTVGPAHETQVLIGAHVAIQAHLVGLITGFLAAGWQHWRSLASTKQATRS
ncbi:MAG: rhombosortase [Vibrio sp.]